MFVNRNNICQLKIFANRKNIHDMKLWRILGGGYTFQKVKVDPILEQIPMGGYIISTFA